MAAQRKPSEFEPPPTDENPEDSPHHLAMIGADDALRKLREELPAKKYSKRVLNRKAQWTVSRIEL